MVIYSGNTYQFMKNSHAIAYLIFAFGIHSLLILIFLNKFIYLEQAEGFP